MDSIKYQITSDRDILSALGASVHHDLKFDRAIIHYLNNELHRIYLVKDKKGLIRQFPNTNKSKIKKEWIEL